MHVRIATSLNHHGEIVMSNLKHTSWLGMLMCAACFTGIANGQFISPDGNTPDQIQPFVDPGTFKYDWQMFAPAEVDYIGNDPNIPIGFFFNYDRTFLSVTRPDAIDVGRSETFSGDPFSGNRYEFGYMTEGDHGWLVSLMNSKGGFVLNPQLVDPTTGGNITNRQITSKFVSVEVSKAYRMLIDDGAYLEPYLGVRYLYFRDQFFQDGDDTLAPQPRNQQKTRNQIFAGQLGMRYVRRKGHWKFSSDVRLAGGPNWQFINITGIDNNGNAYDQNSDFEEFSPVGDFRVDVQYQLTRDLSIRLGAQAIYFIRNMARVDTSGIHLPTPQPDPMNPVPNVNFLPDPFSQADQDIFMGGVSFGFVWNR